MDLGIKELFELVDKTQIEDGSTFQFSNCVFNISIKEGMLVSAEVRHPLYPSKKYVYDISIDSRIGPLEKKYCLIHEIVECLLIIKLVRERSGFGVYDTGAIQNEAHNTAMGAEKEYARSRGLEHIFTEF
jgi:hypothetical protein